MCSSYPGVVSNFQIKTGEKESEAEKKSDQ